MHMSGGGGGGGFARSGGGIPGGGASFAARSGGGNVAVRGGQNFAAQQSFAARQGGGNMNRGDHGRRHFRGGPGFVYGFGGPAYDDGYYDASPYGVYDDYAYSDDGDNGCYQVRIVRGEYRRAWVCQ
jgi:hypothetical protein